MFKIIFLSIIKTLATPKSQELLIGIAEILAKKTDSPIDDKIVETLKEIIKKG